MKKLFWAGWAALAMLGFFSSQASAQLSVNGSTAPGTITVGTINFAQLLPPVTIFFGASPGAPTPTIVSHALGNPVNQRGFIWPSANFVVFGASNFITTGTGTILFSSPSPAVNVAGLYSIVPAGGAFVGSVGYGFPNSSPDQAFGTYNVTIGIGATSFGSVGFTLTWTVNPIFNLIVTPATSADNGNFGSVAFGEAPANQAFILATQTNQGVPYIITLNTDGITNECGTQLQGIKVFSDGFSGNNLTHVTIPIKVATPVLPNQEVVLYRSNEIGNSDFFNLGLAIVPPLGQQAGDYSGSLVLTLLTI